MRVRGPKVLTVNRDVAAVLQGDRSADLAAIARRRAAAPLKPSQPQKASDVGLFSDDTAQLDLIDMTRRKP